ncbi:hypothetical protein DY000_02043736 [Brassica cretica]|uniref:2-oxoacid dehydrogenase acyltransferase catalytic domain-containing protein n=1 Tax=Brassica cretica TaxID=69181 RepID=A0ABQ7BLM7_BRACR|nr:hypothetical protein DY000_02043736 [Brassica cretica]
MEFIFFDNVFESVHKLSPEDVTGGTITLSNIGAIGGKFGSPLLNLPEVAIIALGRIEKVPKFKGDGTVYPASTMMVVNTAADHRVLDGATVARFCCQWKEIKQQRRFMFLCVNLSPRTTLVSLYESSCSNKMMKFSV